MISPVTVPNIAPAIKLGTVSAGKKIHLRVVTAAVTVRIAASREELDRLVPLSGQQSGFTFTSTDNMVEMGWEGDVFAEGVVANASQPVILFDIN